MRQAAIWSMGLAALIGVTGIGQADAAEVQCGGASWYAMTSRTASGETADPDAMAAAHRSLPFGTRVKVENLRNGRAVIVRINDRGPFVRGRVIDVTRAAAASLGFVNHGTTRVRITAIDGSGFSLNSNSLKWDTGGTEGPRTRKQVPTFPHPAPAGEDCT